MRNFTLPLSLLLLFTVRVQAAEITVKGSDTMVVMAQRWAEGFMKENPGVSLQVTGGGSGTGIAALLNNTTDMAASSRPIKPKESSEFLIKFGKPAKETRTSLDGLAVYVNEENPIRELTVAQLDAIFRGEITNFSKVGGADLPINLYSRENNSGTYAYFKEHVLKDKDFAATAQNMPGTAALINAISKDKAAIGYGGIAYAKGARAIGIKPDAKSPAVLPVMEKVISGEYPLSRYLFVYTNPVSTKAETQQFLSWIVGPKGQAIVAESGYFPLPGAKPDAVASTEVPPQPEKAAVSPAAVAPAPPVAQAPAVAAVAVNAAEVVERETAMAKREQAVAEREAMVALREARIAGREAQIAEREVYVAEQVATAPRKQRQR